MPEVRGIIASLDIMPPQVMIEAIVIERSLDSDNDMGMQWKWDNPNTANSSLGKDGILNLGNLGLIGQKAMGAQYALLSEGLDVIMSAISSDSKTNVISTPRILAANDTPATINVVTQVPFITTKRVENNGATQETWDYKPVGVTLTVTPRIGESGQIYLEMSQTTDSFTQTTAGGNPVINTRETESSMIVQDGQTLVMGGLIRDNQSSAIQKVPILGDLPILGYFFRTNKQVDSKTELVVFIRPTIVRTQADAAALTAQDTSKFGTDLMQKAGVVKP
jgi:general secretion pathway protein D